MSDDAATPRVSRPDLIAAAVLAVMAAVLYVRTLCPTVYWYDSAEFSAHAVGLGVPHPPGYPLYTLVAHVFTWLPVEPALAVNIMSLTFGVASVVLAYAIVRQLGGSLMAAAIGAATLMVIRTMWANAVVAEVYTPGLVMTFGALSLLLRAHVQDWRRGSTLAGLVGGLGVGMHMSITTFGLGYAWLVWTRGLPERLSPKMLVSQLRSRLVASGYSLLAAVGGLLIFAYVPLRKFQRWDAREWTVFRKNSTGGAFKRKFLQDYDLQERWEFVGDIFVDNLQVAGLVLAVGGLGWLLWRRPKMGIGVVLAAAGNLWWFFNYNVPDLDVFFLPCLAVLCVGVGLSADALATPLQRLRPALGHVGWALLLLPAFLVQRNYEEVDLSDDREAAAYGEAVCDAVPNDARVVLYSSPTEWRYYSVFIYMQATAERCAGAGIWKKPNLDSVDRALRRGDTVFTFRALRRLKTRFRVVPVGPLWRLLPKAKMGGRAKPVRSRRTRPKP
ncbi:MAG: DUF2723 domain-containing protein [Myxococcota bacterium]